MHHSSLSHEGEDELRRTSHSPDSGDRLSNSVKICPTIRASWGREGWRTGHKVSASSNSRTTFCPDAAASDADLKAARRRCSDSPAYPVRKTLGRTRG